MRIDSSVIGMESTRRYSSVTSKSVRASSARLASAPYEGYNGMGRLFGNLLGSDSNMGQKEQTEQTEENEESSANLEDITTHFRNLSNTTKVRGRNTPEDTLMTIRQRCIEFLMELFFDFRRDREDLWGIKRRRDNVGLSSQYAYEPILSYGRRTYDFCYDRHGKDCGRKRDIF